MAEEYTEYFANEESENELESDEELWEFENDDESSDLGIDDITSLISSPAPKMKKVEDRNWIGGAFEPQLFTFDEKNSGISPLIQDENKLPIYWFERFFDSRLMDMIVGETNRYHDSIPVANNSNKRKHPKQWVPVNREELYCFLAVVMLMSAVKKATMKLYWSQDPLLHTPIFGEIMPQRQIHRYIAIFAFQRQQRTACG